MEFNPAAMFYCLSALKYYEDLTEKDIRDIGFEIALIGQNGIDFNNPDSRYYIKSLNKNLSGLQAMSYMYVAWKTINATMDIGIDFQEEYLMAKRLLKKEESKSDILQDQTKSYILSFSELGVNKAMSDDEILLKVIQFGGFKTPRAVTIDVIREVEIVLVNSMEFLRELSDIDKESFEQAINNAQNGKIQLALNQFKRLLTKYPKKASILENVGKCYLELRQWNDAKLYYGFALECEETEYGNIGLANAYMRLGDINKAIQHYEQATVLNPASALAYNNLAAAMMEVNRPNDAEKNFLKALDLEPNNPQTLLGIGLMYKETGDFQKAKDYINKADRNSDKAPHLKTLIAQTHNQLNYSGNIDLTRVNIKANTDSQIPDLCDEVKKILTKAESIGGKGFQFLKMQELTHYAAIRIARKNDKEHIIYYKKERSDLLQHLIAHECGHLIRIFSAKESDRVVPATSDETKEIAFTEMQDDIIRLSKQFPETELSIIMNMYYDGVVRQATNQPVDYLIEKWLYDEYPGLHHHQFSSLQNQAEESVEALSDEVRRITPPVIYHASNLMNYAYLRLVGFHIHANFIKRYNGTEFVNPGKSLAERTKREQEDSFLGDIKMINIWSETVGITKWFEWVDFEKNR